MWKKIIDWVASILLIVGGLNWGLIATFDYNLVTNIFGVGAVSNVVYILVGLSAIWVTIMLIKKK